MKKRLTDQQKIDMVSMYLTGKYSCEALGKHFGINGCSINRLLRYRGIKLRENPNSFNRKHHLNESYFDQIDTEEKAYFLGFLYADGYNSEDRSNFLISLQEEDGEILEIFRNLLGYTKPNKLLKKKKNVWKNQIMLSVFSKKMSVRLAELGCHQAKSLTLKFPGEEQVPSNLLRHFIRGYFDGDGGFSFYLDKKKNSYKICSEIVGTENFCQTLKEIIEKEVRIGSYLYRPKNSTKRDNTTRVLKITGTNYCLSFLEWLYGNCTIKLKRKHDKFIEIKNKVVSIRDAKKWEAFGERKMKTEWFLDSRCVVSQGTIDKRIRQGIDFQTAISKKRIGV